MDFKSSILDLKKAIKKSLSFENSISEKKATTEEPSIAMDKTDSTISLDSDFLDGMSSATARIVIEKSLPENYNDIYEIEELQNQGRYYIAKIIEPPGKVAARLLVDKLNGTVHFPKDNLKR